MELSDLRKDWQDADVVSKNEQELKRMADFMHHPVVRRIKVKFLIEFVSMTILLFVYYDWFDGDKKPVYANILFVSGIILYMLNNTFAYVSLMLRPVTAANIKHSHELFLTKVKRLSVASIIISFIYAASFVLFFFSTITFTHSNYNLLVILIVMLILMFYLSHRLWRRWIKQLTMQVREFNSGYTL